MPWPKIEAYAKEHDERALDPRKCMFHNLKAFKAAREQIDEIASVHIKGDVKKIPWVGKNLGDECRQCGLDGEPAASLDALYEVAALASVQFEEIMTAACPESGVKLMFAPLKGRDRAGAKARDEYADKTAPCYSWLFDITRGAALCQTEDAILQLYASLEADDRVDIVRTKNRFARALQRLPGHLDERRRESRERDAHVRATNSSHADQRVGRGRSHTVYVYFRSFFLGNSDAVAQRLEILCVLPVDEANDVEEWWTTCSGPTRTRVCLRPLCEAARVDSGAASGVLKVRRRRLSGDGARLRCGERGVGVALYHLGRAYGDLGDYAKAERSWSGRSRSSSGAVRNSTKRGPVADVLNSLGNA